MRYVIMLVLLMLCGGMVGAQDDTAELTPYEIAQARIAEAYESGATTLDLSYLELTILPPEIGMLTNLTGLGLGNNALTALPLE
ncbi:MAG: hypothetical protein AAFN11_20780, partial [Chloroflexota bacterium]